MQGNAPFIQLVAEREDSLEYIFYAKIDQDRADIDQKYVEILRKA